ncbi:MAG: hypothetical protein ABIP89_24010, partial [Polyangiaceae bacterium]
MRRRALFWGVSAIAIASVACGGDEKTLPQIPPPPPPVHAPVAVVDAGASPAEPRFDAPLFRTAINEALESYLAGDPVNATQLG